MAQVICFSSSEGQSDFSDGGRLPMRVGGISSRTLAAEKSFLLEALVSTCHSGLIATSRKRMKY